MGGFSAERMPGLTLRLLVLYKNDPDPGIHSAIGWVLRNCWGKSQEVDIIDAELAKRRSDGKRKWYVNGQLQTFSIVVGPNSLLPLRLRRLWLPHCFAIATTEVTVGQFGTFRKTHKVNEKIAPDLNCPVNSVKWYDAAAYCNWVSEKEGISPDQWCYKPDTLEPVSNYQSLTGYRLPTEQEWEFACVAGAQTPCHFGQLIEELADRYARWYANSRVDGNCRSFPVASLKPNDWGLFDMHGNILEWCQEPMKPSGIPYRGDVDAAELGGWYSSDYHELGPDDRRQIFPRKMDKEFIGFRIVRTVKSHLILEDEGELEK